MLSRLLPHASVVSLKDYTFEVREVTFGDLAYLERWAMDIIGNPLSNVKLIEDPEERLKELHRLYYEYEHGQDMEKNQQVSNLIYQTLEGQATIIARMTTLTYDEAYAMNVEMNAQERNWLFGMFSSSDIGKDISIEVDRELGISENCFTLNQGMTLSDTVRELAFVYHYTLKEIAEMTLSQVSELYRINEKVRCIDRTPTQNVREVYKKRSAFHKKYNPVKAKPTNGQTN